MDELEVDRMVDEERTLLFSGSLTSRKDAALDFGEIPSLYLSQARRRRGKQECIFNI